MSLRVIAGTARGMKLKPVPGDSTRPVMDRVKEALFSIIGAEIIGAHVLDLFAGTGSVGIEALSRGAAHALFIERSGRAIRTVRANLAHTRLDDRARVMRRDSFKLLSQPPDSQFQFIYIAPPQYQGLWLRALEALDGNPAWHNPNCRVIVQIDPREYQPEPRLPKMALMDQRVYGNTMLLFYAFDEHASE